MNHTTVINIRTEISVKKQAQDIAKNLGLNLSALINGYLKQLIRTKTVVFSTREEPSEYLIKSLEQSKKDIKNGFVSLPFDNAKDANEWLDDSKAKYANQICKEV